MAGPYDILAVGYACLDYISVIDRLPEIDEKMMLDNLVIQGGGPSATGMVAAARLGARTGIVTCLADDGVGQQIAGELGAEGVDVSPTRVRRGGHSGFSFALIQRGTGLRTIVFWPPSVERLSASDVDMREVRRAKVLFIDGFAPEAELAACREARKAGVPVIFDAGNEKAGMEELVRCTDVLIASKGFGRDVAGSDDPAEAAAFFRRGGLAVAAVTAGADGAYFCTEEGAFHQEAFKVKVADTTGAGDAFHGAYAYGMTKGWPARRCAKFAAAVAAIKCTKVGGRTGLPRLGEVETFLAGEGASGR